MRYYGDVLYINVDPNYKSPTPLKTRRADWNKQGGGLGVVSRDAINRTFSCSTGGIVYKGSTYWVLTASHCTNDSASPFLQWGSILGTRHSTFNAYAGGRFMFGY
ncbi:MULTISPECIES: hypothetical protein [Bacillus]|uniref:hypothetical protein n=1 Tax=Bacillus TaxID=1386 RepID=UPI0003153FA0|nr:MULTISPECIES: hypothetical protein [Bacillus]